MPQEFEVISPGPHCSHCAACPPRAAVRQTAIARRARCCSGEKVEP